MFTFGYFNGNSGRELTFDTKAEAMIEADTKWNGLTRAEKAKYTDPTTGAYFAVFEGGNSFDDCRIVEDWADRIEREKQIWAELDAEGEE